VLKLLLQDHSKRFAVCFGGLLLLLLSSVASINWIANPMAQYPTHYFRPMVQESRAEKVQLVNQLESQPEGIVLGSSRVMKLEPDYLQQVSGQRFFNAGVNYGKPEDYLAWLRLYHDRYESWPRTIIIGIDSSAFSSAIPVDARLINSPDLATRIPETITWVDRCSLWKDLFSWNHTKLSCKSLAMQLRNTPLPEPIEHYRPDGLLVYDLREAQIRDGKYDLQSAIAENENEYSSFYLGFKSHSLERRLLMRDIAKLAQENHTRLIVFITPMHPELQAQLNAKANLQKRHDEVLFFLERLSVKYPFELFDFADIQSFGGTADLFVDGTHPLEPNTRKMIDIMFGNQQIAHIK
jgi:hypothetical protein